MFSVIFKGRWIGLVWQRWRVGRLGWLLALVWPMGRSFSFLYPVSTWFPPGFHPGFWLAGWAPVPLAAPGHSWLLLGTSHLPKEAPPPLEIPKPFIYDVIVVRFCILGFFNEFLLPWLPLGSPGCSWSIHSAI